MLEEFSVSLRVWGNGLPMKMINQYKTIAEPGLVTCQYPGGADPGEEDPIVGLSDGSTGADGEGKTSKLSTPL